jgi:hypothetical protein
MADCHLGKRQYNSGRRQNDLTRGYLDTVDAAVGREVDFILLAGDLFERRTIDPVTLVYKISGLNSPARGRHSLPEGGGQPRKGILPGQLWLDALIGGTGDAGAAQPGD